MDKMKKTDSKGLLLLKINCCSLAISLTALTCVCAHAVLYKDKYKMLTDPDYVSSDSFSEDTIEESLQANTNLTDDEKDFIKSNFDIVSENSEYINVDLLNYVLKNLKIVYANDDRDKYNVDSSVLGLYYSNKYQIILFDCDSFNNCKKDTFLHELDHAFGEFRSNNCDALGEAVNETIRCEYDDTACFKNRYYQIESLVLYSLCEIIDPQVFLEYHFTGDVTPVKNALNDIIDDPTLVDKLLVDINNITKYENSLINSYSDKSNDYMDNYTNFINNNNEIYSIIKGCFETKYGFPMEEDSVMNIYLNNYFFVDGQYYIDDNFMCKGYFNDDYIVRNPYMGYYLIGDETINYIQPDERRRDNDIQKSITK